MFTKAIPILITLSHIIFISSKAPKQYVELLFKMQDISRVIKNDQGNLAFLGGKKQASFRQICLAKIIETGLFRLPQITGLRSPPKFKNILSLISNQSYKYIIEYEQTNFVAVIKGTCLTRSETYTVDQVTYTPNSGSTLPRPRPAGFKNAEFRDSCLARLIEAGIFKLPQIVKNKIGFNRIEYLETASKSYVVTLQKNNHKGIITGKCNFLDESFRQTETSYQYEATIAPDYPLNRTKIFGQSVVTNEAICLCRLAEIGQRTLMNIIDVKSLNFTRLFQDNVKYVGTKNLIALYQGTSENNIFLAYYIGSCFYDFPYVLTKTTPTFVAAGFIKP